MSRIQILVLGSCLSIGGLIIIATQDWVIGLGVFLMVYGNNLERI